MRESRLEQAAAVELAAALAGYIAGEAGIPLLMIKGPVLAAQGLRPARAYADVDVWVPTGSVEEFVGHLRQRGWHEREANWFTDRVGSHSVTLVHDRWPCDIDVHRRFPGFLAPDAVVFDALWNARSEIDVAGRPIASTGQAGSAAILALHSLRQMWDGAKSAEFDFLLLRLTEHPPLIEEVRRLAAVTGANETLAPLFRRLEVRPMPGYRATPAQLREWSNRRAHHSRTGQWIDYLKTIPVAAWPRELATVLWPSPEHYLQDHPESATTRRALFAGRAGRLAKGLSGVGHIAGQRFRAALGRVDFSRSRPRG